MALKTEQLNLQMMDITGSKFKEVRAEKLDWNNANLAGTHFQNVNMSELTLRDVNLSGTTISDANLSGTRITAANLSGMVIDHVHLFGAQFRHIVLPQEGDYNFDPNGRYSPITFTDCNLNGSRIEQCDLSEVEISGCTLTGMKINGIPVEDLLKKYRES